MKFFGWTNRIGFNWLPWGVFLLGGYGCWLGLAQIFQQDRFAPPRSEYGLELRHVAPVDEVPPFCPRTVEMGNDRPYCPPPRRRNSSRSVDLQQRRKIQPLVEKYAQKYALPPGLIYAIIERESLYDPHAQAPDGGKGLMQLMPEVIAEQKCPNPFNPEANIKAGCAHLAQLLKRFSPTLPEKERISFALASYNGGWGHVVDARKLAVELQLNPDRWAGEVAEAIIFLKYKSYYSRYKNGRCQGDMVVNYVSGVLALWESSQRE